jgi:salicylate biosynthesis isochorismate synthase
MARDEDYVLWREPFGEMSFFAVGCAVGRTFHGSERYDEARTWCLALTEQLLELPQFKSSRDTPLFLGGFRFTRDQGEHEEVWRDWPAGRVWIPRLLIVQAHGSTHAVIARTLRPGLDPQAWCTSIREKLSERPEETVRAYLQTRSWTEEPDENEAHAFKAGVAQAVNSIRKTALHKVVLARNTTFRCPENECFDPIATAYRLRDHYPSCATFAIGQASGSAFVGATPEPLVERIGEQARTVALAGTKIRGASESDDLNQIDALVSSKKERLEHELVVRALESAVSDVSLAIDVPKEPNVRTLRNLHHLETPLHLTLQPGVSILDLVDRLHPSPAIGGQPRHLSLNWIQEHESIDRGWYAGPIGWWTSRESGRFYVALRSAVLKGSTAIAFAGAGLVEGSVPQSEWLETEGKLSAIRHALQTRPRHDMEETS